MKIHTERLEVLRLGVTSYGRVSATPVCERPKHGRECKSTVHKIGHTSCKVMHEELMFIVGLCIDACQ